MSKRATAVILGLGVIAAAFAMGGCETINSRITWQENGVPRHDRPDQDWWHYLYVYHPEANVYYQPYSERYFWSEEEAWYTGTELPSVYTLNDRTAEIVKVRNELPFLQHDSMVWVAPAAPAPPFPDRYIPEFGQHHSIEMATVDAQQ